VNLLLLEDFLHSCYTKATIEEVFFTTVKSKLNFMATTGSF
jgi:hypothetical protein